MGNKYFKQNPSMLVGKMCHNVIELFMQGTEFNTAVEQQYTYLEWVKDSDVKWGKTGSREGVIKDFTNAIKMYFEEMPDYSKILGIEERIEAIIEDQVGGVIMKSPLPLLGIPDLIFEEDGQIIIEDYKFKGLHTSIEEGIPPAYLFQGIFYFLLVRSKYNRAPKEIRFREVKIWKNKDGSSQHNVITISFSGEQFECDRALFWYQLMGMCRLIENASPESYFPYNTFDMMWGRETYQLLQNSEYGYAQKEAVKTDYIKMEKGEIKEAKFIESKESHLIEEKIKHKFMEFGIALTYEKIQQWYAFDRYLFVPSRGVKMSDVKKYSEDVAQATEMENIRIVAPVPGTKFVWVEIPRSERQFKKYSKRYGVPVGVDIDGTTVEFDLKDSNTPHLIVAGRTGSWKSEFLKVLIESFGKDYSLALIDPKYVELSMYKKKAMAYANTPSEALQMLTLLEEKMRMRYADMEKAGVNNIDLLTGKLKEKRIVCIIEEYASLRLDKLVWKDIEDLIVQISNLGRASWIHLILATQRPDVNVISGRIKANIGARACFATASQIDSKIIIEQPGAEKLGGKGDLLYLYPGKDPVRLQAFHL